MSALALIHFSDRFFFYRKPQMLPNTFGQWVYACFDANAQGSSSVLSYVLVRFLNFPICGSQGRNTRMVTSEPCRNNSPPIYRDHAVSFEKRIRDTFLFLCFPPLACFVRRFVRVRSPSAPHLLPFCLRPAILKALSPLLFFRCGICT